MLQVIDYFVNDYGPLFLSEGSLEHTLYDREDMDLVELHVTSPYPRGGESIMLVGLTYEDFTP